VSRYVDFVHKDVVNLQGDRFSASLSGRLRFCVDTGRAHTSEDRW
jgi:hypothetical protein